MRGQSSWYLTSCSPSLLLLFLLLPIASPDTTWVLGEKDLNDDAYLVMSRGSQVEGGASVLYSLSARDPLELVLTSTVGDADIYVSSKSNSPSPDDYELSSATCASDSIFLSKTQPRPVYISVFGHPHHPLSSFVLEAYVVPSKFKTYEDIFEATQTVSYESLAEQHVVLKDTQDYLSPVKSDKTTSSSKAGEESLDSDDGWLEWVLEGEDGWALVITILAGVFKFILQVLG